MQLFNIKDLDILVYSYVDANNIFHRLLKRTMYGGTRVIIVLYKNG
jgi:hypothetical protein